MAKSTHPHLHFGTTSSFPTFSLASIPSLFHGKPAFNRPTILRTGLFSFSTLLGPFLLCKTAQPVPHFGMGSNPATLTQPNPVRRRRFRAMTKPLLGCG